MPITNVDGWSTTANSNSDVGGISIATGMSPSNIDNALREIMAQVAATPLAETAATMRTNLGVSATADTPTLVSLEGLSLVAGDILYATAADTLARLPKGTALQYLQQNSALTAPQWATGREVLTASRTYYVATTGNNSNSGLAVDTPFLTIQKAFDVIFGTLDLGGFDVTIQLADGTYTSGVAESGSVIGSGNVVVNGNATTPANVIVSTTSASCFVAAAGAKFEIRNLEVRTTTAGEAVVATGNGSNVSIGTGMRFGTSAGRHILADYGGFVDAKANYSIVGGATMHWGVFNSAMLSVTSRTITITGTPAFSVGFLWTEGLGNAQVFLNTFSGSATGTRYFSGYNSYIHTNSGGASYIPGSVAGSVSNGGIYR